MKLQSYAAGEWYQSPSSGLFLHNAINGEEVAEISSAGIDFQSMLDYARNIGGPALRHYTFHQRAQLF